MGPNAPPPPVFASPPPVTVKDGFTYAVLGDIALVRPVTQLGLPELDKVLQIVRNADFALGNQEGTAFHTATKRFAVNETGAMFPSDSSAAWDIKNMGVRMVTVANNHSADYGADGLLENLRLLRAAGVPYAGAGNNMREARAATLFNTPKGRVTVVATAGTFTMNFAAADGRGALAERPGISTIRTTTFQQVTAREMRLLQQLSAARNPNASTSDSLPQQLMVLDQIYQLGDKPGLSYRANQFDMRDIMQAVHKARENSDFTIFTIHAHQSATGEDDPNPVPGDYLVQLFHNVVDAGADVVAGHGNHLLRGIEIYKGKPIFYGMGNFIAQSEFIRRVPFDSYEAWDHDVDKLPTLTPGVYPIHPGLDTPLWWSSAVIDLTFDGHQVREIRLHPVEMGRDATEQSNIVRQTGSGPHAFTEGRPYLADRANGKIILERLQRLSAGYGTKVEIENGIGVIRL
jgi:poly-gamma-glutamate synthesis protein (capsule biosynthesis protein)